MNCAICGRELPEAAIFCPRCTHAVDGASECDDYAYEAFISYRHVPEDRALARRIQRRIEGYHVPREFQREGRVRLGKCFRDEDELPTSDSLPHLIEDALRRSRFLIVICSPRMRESLWVAREVELFSAYHGRSRILLALADGEPTEAFPPLLMSITEKNDGELVERDAEPIAADMRRGAGKRFSNELLRILAPIVGCGYDDLRQRSRSRRMKNVAIAACATAALGIAFGGATLFQQIQIRDNYESALRSQSEYLAEEATTLLEQGDRMQAIQIALHALGEDGDIQRPYVPSARLALEQACQVYPERYWRPCYSNIEKADIISTSVSISADGSQYAAMTTDGTIYVYDVSTGATVCEIPPPTYTFMGSEGQTGWRTAALYVGDTIIALDNAGDFDGIVGYNPTTGEELYRTPIESDHSNLLASPDSTLVAITSSFFSEVGDVTICNVRDGSVVFEAPDSLARPTTNDELSSSGWSIGSFSEDARLFAAPSGAGVAIFDIESGEQRQIEVNGEISSLLIGDGAVFVGTSVVQSGMATAVVTAYDTITAETLWSYDQRVSSDLFEVNKPVILEIANIRGGSLLVAIGSDAILFSPSSGEKIATVYSESRIDLAHFFDGDDDNTGIAYAGDGTLRTISNLAISEEGTPIVDAAPSSDYTAGDDPEANGMAVKFFVSDEGEKTCLLTLYSDEDREDRYGTLLFKYDRYNTCPGMENVNDEVSASKLGSSSTLRSVKGCYLATFDYGTHSILVFSGNTFDLLGSFDLSTMGDDISADEVVNLFFSPEDDHILYAYAVDDNRENTLLYALDVESGATLGSIAIPDTYMRDSRFEVRDGFVRYTISERADDFSLSQYLVTADALTLEEISRVALDVGKGADAIPADSMCTAGTTLFVDSGSGLEAFDMMTGEPLACDCSKTQLGFGNTIVTNPRHTKLLAITMEGLMALDESGQALWKIAMTTQSHSSIYAAFTQTDDVVLREESGQCLLLNGDDGSILATSQTTVGPVTRTWQSANGTHLYASTSDGIAVIHLDPSSFGVESLLPLASAVTQDESRALFVDYRGTYTLPLYTTNELAAYARELTKGHELTDAERRLYHLV